MKVLTLSPCWAWAVVHAGKDVENRSWSTAHRGPLLIHAAGRLSVDWEREAAQIERLSDLIFVDEVDVGAIVGLVDVLDCHQASERCGCHAWAAQTGFHWRLGNPRAIVPVEIKGRLGLWTYDGPIVYACHACEHAAHAGKCSATRCTCSTQKSLTLARSPL